MTVERRWIIGLVAALTLSLGANLVIAGITIARHIEAPPPPPFSFETPTGVEGMFGDLSAEGRAVVRQSMRESRRDLRDTYRQMRVVQTEIKSLLDAQALDRTALEAAFAKLAALKADVQTRLYRDFVEVASKLSAEDRRRFTPARPDRPPRHRDQGGKPAEDMPPPPPDGGPFEGGPFGAAPGGPPGVPPGGPAEAPKQP